MESLRHKFKGSLLKDDILAQIKLDMLKIGDMILPEKKLAEKYNVSYLTVRKAISELEKENILKRYKGKGTFVTGLPAAAKKNRVEIQVMVSRPATLQREQNPICWFVTVDVLKGVLDCCIEYEVQSELVYANEKSISYEKPAIILNGLSLEEKSNFEKKNTPYVIVNQDVNYPAYKITCDDAYGTYSAAVYLIKAGYRKIAYLGSDLKVLHTLPRYNGFMSALSEYGLKPAGIIFEKTTGISNSCVVMENFLREAKEIPDALICSTDWRAIGAMEAIKKQGLRIPEDMGVIGFDDIAEACFTEPPLTTVAKPRNRMGYEAVKFILNWEENVKNKISTKIFKPELVIRGTIRQKLNREKNRSSLSGELFR
ncbi:MAG TPA: substrate-binding domain-containing protein [bacterium]|nr:substrate-binding domain-containing protein [bacterium]